MKPNALVPAAVLLALAGTARSADPPAPTALELSALLPAGGGDGSDGFVVLGGATFDFAGDAVGSAGDVNADGFDDVIIGAPYASPSDGAVFAGRAYVIFGGPDGPPVRKPTGLDGTTGFAINGANIFDLAGISVAGAGDVNGDGVDDVVVGAYYGPYGTGAAYVVFGGPTVGAGGAVELASLDGTNGFAVYGVGLFDALGRSVAAAGDVNGDGFGDVVLGAPYAFATGKAYVVYGGPDVGAGGAIFLDALTGDQGFGVRGVEGGDSFGRSVSGAGDFNGDGFDDVIIGAPFASPLKRIFAGESYIVFGGPAGSPDALGEGGVDRGVSHARGVVLRGANYVDLSGFAVSGAGDINADGFADVLVGSPVNRAGTTYVYFGSADAGSRSHIELSGLNGLNGFRVLGFRNYDFSGAAVSRAGDVNGDGLDDLIIGAPYATPSERSYAGTCAVVFGGPGVGASGSFTGYAWNGANGFTLNGVEAFDFSGFAVAGGGDVNGDGFDDVIVGAPDASPKGDTAAGEAFVVFGGVHVVHTPPLEPGPFSLIGPSNGATGVALAPTLTWKYSTEAASYFVQIDDDIAFGSPVVSSVVSAPTTTLELADATLAPSTHYFWRVIAKNETATRAGAPAISSFFTAAPPPACVGDLSGDDTTNIVDFGIFAAHFGQHVSPGAGGDLNADGVIDIFDFGIFATDFGCTP